jgi:hypothetical protein
VHGLPRATGDIDIWILTSAENADRVWATLVEFGAPMNQVDRTDFSTGGLVFQIGIAPRRIHVLTSIDGVSFLKPEINDYADRRSRYLLNGSKSRST